jgi:pimeloyl-ACP methyl ester carboxylesterase
VAAVVLLASVGPGCVNGWDKLLAAADTLVPVDTARRLARDLPDARLQLVQGAGHHLPRRAPDAVADAMVAFPGRDRRSR